MRKIIHIDMDAFYASVEQRDNPDLRGKPIAVGGDEKRGVTTTASYEARVFGVRSAMPGWQAKKLCPDLIFVPIRFDAYREASAKIRAIFRRYTDLIEPLSLDEAYLDVTENKINEPIATIIAQRIKDEIFAETQLTASAGISYCKFLAKVASDMNKPNGLTVIKPHEAVVFLEKLPVGKFYGVGKVTKAKMESLGIHTGADLKKWSKVDLMKTFGKSGGFYYNIVRGDDQRPVQPNQIRKSYAVERTFDTNITEMHEVYNFGEFLIEKLMVGIEKHNLRGRTLTLKTKNADFIIKTRSVTLDQAMINKDVLTYQFHKLIADNEDICQNLRLMGITLSKFDHEALSKMDGQLTLGFDENQ